MFSSWCCAVRRRIFVRWGDVEKAGGLLVVAELWQFVRRNIPRRFRLPENAVGRPRFRVSVEHAGGNQHVVGGVDLVRHAGAAIRTERHRKTFGLWMRETLQQRFAGGPFELRFGNEEVGRMCASARLPAAAAMAVTKGCEGRGCFEFDRAAQTAAGDG